MATAANRPPWPINRGFKILKSWTPDATQRQGGCLEVTPADEGKVVLLCDPLPDGGQWVRILLPRRNLDGYIPWIADIITVGPEDRLYGEDLKINFRLPPIKKLSSNFNEITFTDLYPRTVMALCIALAEKGQILDIEAGDLGKIRNPAWRQQLVVEMANSARQRGIFDHLNNPTFHLKDLVRNLQLVGPESRQKGGIYIQILRNFQGNPVRKPEIRIGKTINFIQREEDHQREKSQNGSRFHTLMNTAQYGMYPLIYLRGDEASRTFAEQITVLQFGTYEPNLLRRNVSAADTDAQALAEEVFKVTGWKPATGRMETFGSHVGHNVTSPLFETTYDTSLTWTRVEIPGVMAVFRRRPAKLSNKGLIYIAKFESSDGSDSQLTLSLQKPGANENGPKSPGEIIHVSIEIMLNGERHPYQYARLWHEDFAPWSDWEEAAGVAIKLEWQDESTGKWYKRYYQKWRPCTPVNDRDRACIVGYGNAIALRRWLLQENNPQQESWRPQRGPATSMKQITFDNLNQVYNVVDKIGSTSGTAAKIRTVQAMSNQIRQLPGVQNVEAPWRNNQFPSYLSFSTRRTKCDMCMILSHFRPCALQQGQTGTCQNCWGIGFICSWTKDYKQVDFSKMVSPPAGDAAIKWVETRDPGIHSHGN